MEVCVFDKNHKMKKSVLMHYLKCHKDEYQNCKANKWYCEENTFIIFPNKELKDKHDEKCEFCKKKKNNINITFFDEISVYGHEVIEAKVPKPKKEVNFPVFDFDKYIIKDKSSIKLNDLDSFIEQEKNILY